MDYLATHSGTVQSPYAGVWVVQCQGINTVGLPIRFDPLEDGPVMPFIRGKAEQKPKISTRELEWQRGHEVEITYSNTPCTDGNIVWLAAMSEYCDFLRKHARVGQRQMPYYQLILGYARSPRLKDSFLSQARVCPVRQLSEPHDQHPLIHPSCETPHQIRQASPQEGRDRTESSARMA